jgi:hypothetical protein
MKTRIGALGLCLAAGLALAQKPEAQQAPSKDSASAPASSAQPASKAAWFKGTLVATPCAGAASASAAEPSGKKKKGEANRSAEGDSSQSCTLSADAKEFALQTTDGRTLAFDAIGNTRAQDALRARKRWEKRAEAGKPVEVVVGASEDSGKLTVVSIEPWIKN